MGGFLHFAENLGEISRFYTPKTTPQKDVEPGGYLSAVKPCKVRGKWVMRGTFRFYTHKNYLSKRCNIRGVILGTQNDIK